MMTFFVPRILTVLSLAVFCLSLPSIALSKPGNKLQGSHGDRSVMVKSCRACHMGMNMAVNGEEDTCLRCHGDSSSREEMARDGYFRDATSLNMPNIAADLSKPYNHPVLAIQGVHQKGEQLPEDVVNAARHAECVDCHEPHLVEKGNPFRGLKGRRVGNFIADIEKEYELCYRCHSESVNLPGLSTNKHDEFKTTNPSFHPVEGEGKNTLVISLKKPYVAQKQKPNEISEISCRDCHGSDEPGAPKGPHGSNFAGLLVLNYQTEDGLAESEHAYALCYKCHDRVSILSNESFPYHSQHIKGRSGVNDGTSCFTCHDAHGSTQYQYLIRFNEEVVFENADGRLKYDAQGYAARRGACYLSCHGVEHNPKEY